MIICQSVSSADWPIDNNAEVCCCRQRQCAEVSWPEQARVAERDEGEVRDLHDAHSVHKGGVERRTRCDAACSLPACALPACEGAGAGRLIETACKPGCVTEKHDRDQGAKPLRITVGVLREYHEGRPHWPPRHTAAGHAWWHPHSSSARRGHTTAGGSRWCWPCRQQLPPQRRQRIHAGSPALQPRRVPRAGSLEGQPGPPISRRDRGSREICQ